MIHVISLGAGVQSSTMALMAAHGEITPMPECAIFADTQSEPQAVYAWLDWLERRLPFPVHRVTAGSLKDAVTGRDMSAKNAKWARPPFFVINRLNGQNGMLNRQCTKYYKLFPIIEKCRELCGRSKGARATEVLVEQWIGISTDEAQRMKPSRDKWIKNRWPLVEAGMTRFDCLKWLRESGWQGESGFKSPPKSACTFCPYRDDAGWKDMREYAPLDFAEAVAVDVAIRTGMPGVDKGELYLHRSLTPLAEADFRSAEDAGQLSMFGNECEGMCGV